MKVPFSEKVLPVPLLVVATTEYNQNVPVVVGTNVLNLYSTTLRKKGNIPAEWEVALPSLCSDTSLVHLTNKRVVKLLPMSIKVMSGMVNTKHHDGFTALTENVECSLSDKVSVCPRVVELSKGGKTRIPVRIFNITAKVVEIKPKSVLCGLNEVKIVRHIDPIEESEIGKKIEIESVEEGERYRELEELGIKLQGIEPDVKDQLTSLLLKWKSVFSTGPTDIGFTNIVEHEIKLTDETPFKDPYRRIPPSMFNEVREHLKEMLDSGVIRESKSPFSSNVVLCRKKDNSLRVCIDFRRINKRTIRDQHGPPRVDETIDCLNGSKFFSKIDLRAAYWQCGIKESDKHKTAFH